MTSSTTQTTPISSTPVKESAPQTASQIASHLLAGLDQTVTWYEHQMTPYYYETTTHHERVRHSRIISSYAPNAANSYDDV